MPKVRARRKNRHWIIPIHQGKTPDADIRSGKNSVHPDVRWGSTARFAYKPADPAVYLPEAGKRDLLQDSSCIILQPEKLSMNRLLLLKKGIRPKWIPLLNNNGFIFEASFQCFDNCPGSHEL
jgi:hypothetical protein